MGGRRGTLSLGERVTLSLSVGAPQGQEIMKEPSGTQRNPSATTEKRCWLSPSVIKNCVFYIKELITFKRNDKYYKSMSLYK